MATSTEQINNLIASNTALLDYFQGARDQIDADLDAAALRVGDTARSFYVDQLNGSAAGDGSEGAPLATIEQAIARSVYNGQLEIILKGDYMHAGNPYFRGGLVVIRSDTAGVKRRIVFDTQVTNTASVTPRFQNQIDNSYMVFQDVTLVACQAAAHVTEKHMVAARGLLGVMLLDSEIELPAGSDQAFVRVHHGCGLIVASTVYPVEMAGRWVVGVAAATDPATLSNIAYTNLESL